MGYSTVEESEEEIRAQRLETAQKFLPRSAQLLEIVSEMEQYVIRLKVGMPYDRMRETLAALSTQLSEVTGLTRGFKALARYHGFEKPARESSNLVLSLMSGGTLLSDERLKAEYKYLRNRVNQIRVGIESVTLSLKETLATAHSDAPVDLVADTLGLEQYQEIAEKMPLEGSEALTDIFTLPVLVTFNRSTSLRELERKGFQAEQVANYVIFPQAHILGINTHQCWQTVNGKRRPKYDLDALLELALAKLAKKLKYPVSLMCEEAASYRNSGWFYYWYGPSSNLDKLGGKLDGRLYVTQFQFPF